jgi:putative phage-type endonuclease
MRGKLLMTVAQAEADRKAWEELRKHGIGGSDAACIMGYNPWKSAYALWCEKTGAVEPEDLSNNEYVYWGTVLEQVVADRFCELTGKKVKKCGTLADESDEYLMANVDRLVIGENAGLECKTANGFKAKEWDGDELPDAYYCQCQWYMMITGCEKWYIACLIGGNHFVWKEIPRNDDFIRELREKATAFWVKNVCEGFPPAVDGSESTEECLKKIYDAPQDNTVMLDSHAGQLIARMDELTATKKLLDEQLKECQNGLQAALGNCEVGLFNDRKVTWKQTAGRVTIDSKALKAELPEVYQKYAKVGKPSRRFTLK